MAKEFVCVPVSPDQIRRLLSGEELTNLQIFRVDDHLMASFGLTTADDEEADRAAMLIASLWALSRYGQRLVLTGYVAQGLLSHGEETENGGALLAKITVRNVEALFADEPEVAPIIEKARHAISSQNSIDEIWQEPAIQELLNHHELLWHTLDEAPQVLNQLS